MNQEKELGEYVAQEIREIPTTLRRLMTSPNISTVAQKIYELDPELIIITGSGSSYHAGMASQYMLIQLLQSKEGYPIPIITVHASEFRSLIQPMIRPNHIVMGISQSGESRDTVQALEVARSGGVKALIGVTNTPGSTIDKMCDAGMHLHAGRENALMATKTYSATVALLFLIGCSFPNPKNPVLVKALKEDFKLLPDVLTKLIRDLDRTIALLAEYLRFVKSIYILGTGADYATAKEGALKLKEGTKTHAEAFSIAEFRHGPVIMADEHTPIIALEPSGEDVEQMKMFSALIEKVKSRNVYVVGIGPSIADSVDFAVRIPQLNLLPLVSVIPFQFLALHLSLLRGYDPDSPPALTKVVL